MADEFWGKKSVATSTDFLATRYEKSSRFLVPGSDPKIHLPYVIDFLFPNAPTLKTNMPSLSVNLRIPVNSVNKEPSQCHRW